jgi:superfamily I DNA/RNA helicase
MSPNAIAKPWQRAKFVAEALDAVRAEARDQALLRRPLDFFLGEIQWINQHGFDERGAYVDADRVGRAEARMQRRQRPLMFDLYEAYVRLRSDGGKDYDWDDVASATLRAFEDDDGDRYYRHVVIDEGQDFSPQMIRSLAAAIPEDGSLTLFGDVAQQIYGRRLAWSDAGLNVGANDVWRFERNYRNSPQIAALGLAIAEMPYYAGEPDMVAPTEFAADGPKPTLVRVESAADETKFVIEQARLAAESGSVAVLLRTHDDESPFHAAFRGAQQPSGRESQAPATPRRRRRSGSRSHPRTATPASSSSHRLLPDRSAATPARQRPAAGRSGECRGSGRGGVRVGRRATRCRRARV